MLCNFLWCKIMKYLYLLINVNYLLYTYEFTDYDGKKVYIVEFFFLKLCCLIMFLWLVAFSYHTHDLYLLFYRFVEPFDN